MALRPLNRFRSTFLQQTPLDQVLGDVVLGSARLFRIIEFKRTANRSHKELSKWRMLSAGLSAENASELYRLSRRIHWYVQSDFRSQRDDVKVVPYLDFPDQKIERTEFTDFVDLTARDAARGDVTEEELVHCRRYLELLGLVQGRGEGASGCLLLIVTEGGGMGFVPAGDLRDFLLTPRQVIERALIQQQALVQNAVERVAAERKMAMDRRAELAVEMRQGLSLRM